MVCGTASDVGKSVIVAGLCRWLARSGISVAPFKAQNMALNSYVTMSGGEIGRAQAAQAFAAGIEPEIAMNPVLLKPTGERTSQVIVGGQPIGELDAITFQETKSSLLPIVREYLDGLRERFDVVILEGAGSPAEINLASEDIVNLGLAQSAGIPAVLVGDIERGGVFAALHGTVSLLDGARRRLLKGFVINKFRGDFGLLDSGITQIEELTGLEHLG
ncbi:MAG TPA: cobyric acid synthase, partial [Acidimicrobiales bacterium]|nr:cobyric acid synthase [Acidimicrobiales bacterium]